MGFRGLGFRVWGLGFKGLGFGVWGVGSREGWGFRAYGFGALHESDLGLGIWGGGSGWAFLWSLRALCMFALCCIKTSPTANLPEVQDYLYSLSLSIYMLLQIRHLGA